MTLKQMAAMRVLKLLALALATGLAVNIALHYLGLMVVGISIAVLVLAWMIKFMYDIEVSRLERENSLEKIRRS
jgi:uncharacterized membrane protein YgaE (UPF0421/DUF939 family)